MLRTYCHNLHTKWVDIVPKIVQYMNVTFHDSTGYTPFELQHGRKPEREIANLIDFPPDMQDQPKPDEIFLFVRQRMRKRAAARQQANAQTNKLTEFAVGDLVLVKCHRLSCKQNKEMSKFFLLYQGPYTVLKVITQNSYLVGTENVKGKCTVQNVRNLKPYIKLN